MRWLLAVLALCFASQAQAAPLKILPPVVSEAALKTFEKDYGLREIPYLQRSLQSRVERQLIKAGADLHDESGNSLRITLLEARPSRLTYQQQTGRTSLDYSLSRSLGGAGLRAELLDATGNVIDTLNYDWYEFDLLFSDAVTPWYDTERAFTYFSLELRKWYKAKA